MKKGMKQKILKPRKGKVQRKGLVIKRIVWLKIRIRSGQMKILMGIIALLGYTAITMKGPKVMGKVYNLESKPKDQNRDQKEI